MEKNNATWPETDSLWRVSRFSGKHSDFFIVIFAHIENASLDNVIFGRQVISAGTNILTLPGMWILAVSGFVLGYRRYGLKQHFFQFKLLLITLIIINAHFFVVPAVSEATTLAMQSLTQGQLLEEYKSAYMRESLFGALNVILTVAAASIGVWRVGVKSKSRSLGNEQKRWAADGRYDVI